MEKAKKTSEKAKIPTISEIIEDLKEDLIILQKMCKDSASLGKHEATQRLRVKIWNYLILAKQNKICKLTEQLPEEDS